jgi:hypothetical protein
MKKTFKNLACLFIATLAIVSCDSVGDDNELNYGTGPYVAQFSTAAKTGFFLKDDNEVFNFDIPLELVGGNGLAVDSDLNLTFEVNTDLSTAIEGTHFTFATSATTAVIPAGNKFASIKINVDSATLDDQNPPVLVLDLLAASADGKNVVVSGNKSRIAITLQGTCTSDLAGNYSVSTTRLSPAGGPYTRTDEFIDEIGVGTYNTTTVGNYKAVADLTLTGTWNDLPAAADAGYDFKDVCGRIRVEEQNLAHAYLNLIKQTAAQYALSTVNEATGVITIEYSIFFTNNTVERTYRSVYTPL